ncbi:MAG: helix-turn-helix domain-containing protein [Clostridiales bacterium]|nr:helix-turn-helix domain-containing protein [Clostridiales bacterium]
MYFDAVKFGQRIANLRKERGVSQEQLAELLNMSRVHLAHIEIGQRAGSIDFMLDIATYFDISLDYLITGEERVPASVQETVQKAIRILSSI